MLGTAYYAVGDERVVAGRKLPLINLLEPAFVSTRNRKLRLPFRSISKNRPG